MISTMNIHNIDSVVLSPIKAVDGAYWRDLVITVKDGSTVTIALFCDEKGLEIQQ